MRNNYFNMFKVRNAFLNALLVSAISLPGFYSWAETKFTYKDLILKDLEQMNSLIKNKIKEAKNQGEGSGVAPLREGLRILLSRPDTDNMIDKLLTSLQNELEERDAWNRVVDELAEESVHALSDSRGIDNSTLITHAIFLENLLTELKPELSNEGLAHDIYIKVRDAKVRLPKAAEKERYRNMMKGSQESPSELAERSLAALKPPTKKEK